MAEMTTSARETAAPSATEYDAFISYSHAADGQLAPALQTGLQSLGKPWHRRRALRVFRDKTSLSATPELWPTIERALGSSRYFLLLASPEAAASRWVDQEVRWWLAHRSPATMLIALTGGEVAWDDARGGFDPARSSALPPAALDWSGREPLWVDLRWAREARHVSLRDPRFREVVADLAAPVRGLPKDELIGQDIRQHRRTMRLARSAVTALVLLLVAALVGALVAVNQRNDARNQARIATARQLAATSRTLAETHLDLARLFAVQAFRMDPNPQTRAALFQAVTSSPFLVRYLWADEPVSAIAGAANGKVAVAGTQHGRVLRWDIQTGARVEVARLRGQVDSVATSADGNTIAAAGSSTAVLWTRHGQVQPLPIPPGQRADLAAVSPSGRFIVMHSQVREDADTSGAITVFDRQSQRSFGAPIKSLWEDLVVPSEAELVLLGSFGPWERRSLSGLARMAGGEIPRGAHSLHSAISPNGRFISYDRGGTYYGGSEIPIWRTTGPTSINSDPELSARMPGIGPQAMALSSDGKRTAVADTGTIYVSDTAAGSLPETAPMTLTGNSTVNYGTGLRFFADNDHLLSASGSTLAVWDLTQRSAISHRMKLDLMHQGLAGEGSRVTVRPDGRAVAVGTDNGLWLVVRGLDDTDGQTVLGGGVLSKGYGPPLWSADSKKLLLVTHNDLGDQWFEIRSADRGASLVGRWESIPEAGEATEAVALSRDGRRAVAVGSNGVTVIRDASTGAVERAVHAPPDLEGLVQNNYVAAVNADATAVAMIGGSGVAGTVKLVNLEPEDSHTVGEGTADGVAFSGQHLLVQRSNGTLEVWDATGTHLERSIPGETEYQVSPAANSQGTLVARQRWDGTVVITDLGSGDTVGSLRLAPALKSGMAFAPDGYTLVTATESPESAGGSQGELQQWDLSEDSWVRIACASAGRNVTAMEWRRYVGDTQPTNLRCG
jgi:WD40 repeat protein